MILRPVFLFVVCFVSTVASASPNAVLNYPPLEPVVANFGPGARIKIMAPVGYKFHVQYSKSNEGAGGFGIPEAKLPFGGQCESCDWSVDLACNNRDSNDAHSRYLLWDEKAQKWVPNPITLGLPFPELHFTVYQIKTPNATGWAYTSHLTAVEAPEKLLDYCIYHDKVAICGHTDVGAVATIHRHPIADRTPYVLKILNSIEFLDDAPPPPGNADIQP